MWNGGKGFALGCVMCLSVSFFGSGAFGMSLAQTPAILEVRAPELSGSAVVGDEVTLEIVLLDAQNEAVPAPHDYALELFLVSESGAKALVDSVLLAQGESALRVYLELPYEGFVSVRAEHPELLTNELFLTVTARADPALESSFAASLKGIGKRVRKGLSLAWAGQPTSPTYYLVVRHTPRAYFANNKDGAELFIALLDEEGNPAKAPRDITLELHSSLGVLEPATVMLAAGTSSTTTKLRAGTAGKAHLTLVSADPDVTLQGEPKVEFVSDVLKILANKSVSLIEPMSIRVILFVPRDVETVVVLTLQGQGRLSEERLVIARGETEAGTRFFPVWPGRVGVTASPAVQDTPPVKDAVHEFDVALTLALVLCTLSLLGGLAGGWVFVTVNRTWQRRSSLARRDRLVIGAVSSFLLFVMLVFGLVPMTPAVFAAVVLNPFVTLGLSLLGGYAGPTLFEFLLKRLPFGKPPSSPQGQRA